MSEAEATRKASLREELLGRRKALSLESVESRGLKVQARFLASPYYQHAKTLALYAPIRGEVPTRDILVAALSDGKTVCYPLSHVHGRVLGFRRILSESELEPGRLGVREPQSSAERVALEEIHVFVVPGLAFGRLGQRMGRGGGYYDATLRAAAETSRRVGLAFSEQVLDDLPQEPHDMEMDLIVTESESLHGLFRPWEFLISPGA
jgi:5-formyltetrahydrofolate cyclo-ligase